MGKSAISAVARPATTIGEARRDGAAQTLPYAGARMLLYSHDTFGLGHLRRCLKIAEAVVQSFRGISVLLLTGSPVVHRYKLPTGVDYVKLPAVRKTGRELYEARTLGADFESVLRMRAGLLMEAVRGFSPHVVIVDHSPAGMKGEMRPSLEWLKTNRPHTTTVLGLRDIVDAPETVIDQWNREGIYDLLRNHYDHILIYGSAEIFDPVASYRFPPDLRDKSHFCHYLAERQLSGRRLARQSEGQRPLVVVTIGGGDGASDTVIVPYLEMLAARSAPIEFDSVILTGPFLPGDLRSRLRRRYAHLPVRLLSHIESTGTLLQRSHLVVATAGYNTTSEVLCLARRAILIPRMLHRQEQYLRARLLADRGLVSYLHPQEVTPGTLRELVDGHLESQDEPLTRARREGRIPFDGCERIVEFCQPILKAHLSVAEVAS